MKVVITTRAIYPLHGRGGLERSVYDLARHLDKAGVDTTVITRTPAASAGEATIGGGVRTILVPYRTFPLAGRRGTTIGDRSTAYPLFGLRAGAAAVSFTTRSSDNRPAAAASRNSGT